MRKKIILLTATALLGFGLSNVFAHGGQYRGPGDTVPPNPGASTPTTPSGPSSPSTPSNPSTPSSPSTPSKPSTPAGPATPMGPSTGAPGVAGGRGPTTGRSIASFTQDLTQWEFWWEFNKAPYLQLKDAISQGGTITDEGGVLGGLRGYEGEEESLKPSVNQKKDIVTPKLEQALKETDNKDIVSSCLVALAKVGYCKNLDKILREKIKDSNPEISETAILCYGIAQMEKAVPDLIELFKDTSRGRSMVKSDGGVHYRKRAFAAYALGLLANGTKSTKIKRVVFEAARDVIDKAGEFANRDIVVSGLMAMRLLAPDLSNEADAKLAVEAAEYTLAYLQNKDNNFQYRAQCPTLLSKLLGRQTTVKAVAGPEGESPAGNPEAAKLKALRSKSVTEFIKALTSKDNNMVVQSSVLALGQIADPKNEKVMKELCRTAEGELSRDNQARNFANMAISELGTPKARNYLLKRLVSRSKKREQPWIAVSLGIMLRKQIQAQEDISGKATLGDVLLGKFRKIKNAKWKSAFAIALGLMDYTEAGPFIQNELEESRHEVLRGYCAVALGLMKYKDAKESMNRVLKKSTRQPEQLKQIAVGLGLLGDKGLVDTLVGMMRKGSKSLAFQSALASGLGFVGDRKAVNPLWKMLFNSDLTDLSRAFAAVALGIVADKDDLPWNSKIGFGLNYRANVETLTGSSTGVLDLL